VTVRVGVFISETTGERTPVDQLVANARDAESRGLATGWVPHIPWSLDALTALAVVARETSTIELGTAVVPTFPRHPMSLAQDAMSVQAIAHGRLALGIGPSHALVIEGMYGLSYDHPAAHTEEYVNVLRACFAATGRVDWDGERFHVHALLDVPGAADVPVLVAALAPRMLELTGRLADGTITYWADERAIAEHVVPRIRSAAAAAGRPPPRVVVGIPVAVTDDVAGARRRAERLFAAYEAIPTYQRILGRGSTGSPVGVAVIGSAAHVHDRLRRFADAGATDVCASVLGLDDDREGSRLRTLDALASLSG
jgi:5,10-methylenetetrahydromethanopterin reductase